MTKTLTINSCFECPWFIKQLYSFKHPANYDTAIFRCGHPKSNKQLSNTQLLLNECCKGCPLEEVIS